MDFGSVPTENAGGAILAHSVQVGERRLRKGAWLTEAHIADLTEAGVTEVTIARLGDADVHEDAAALQLAQALVPDPAAVHLELGRPGTGRVNILATRPGIAAVDAAKINALNNIDPMITVATVPEWQRMASRGMVATVKIISYGVAEDALRRACDAGRGGLTLRPAELTRATLIQTRVGTDDGEKGHAAIAQRMEALSVDLDPKHVVPHAIAPLSEALLAAEGEVLCILTGSATSDLLDVAPEAVRRAGGTVHHFGMPVDPGNLLFLGALGDKPVIGLPGCAKSPALNGADWVLERIICAVPVTPTDIMGMGVGGLLKEIPTRPQPRRAQSSSET
ncbi:molybdopterin-binding protein [Litoreibacter roseus]|uniref:Molybdopterin biosynthesis protein n=1 Tax=Litoreibacter roseus TaxID=2601869 RepID=A0A6N6JDX1_9RHOB|nr:molybdopterin-binding protein [Litoreibacter roseus]GFE64030.1 molybdopterin biosynthesis protein [Litoreibacter roseus]